VSALALAMLACALGGGDGVEPTDESAPIDEAETEELGEADIEATAFYANVTATAQARAALDQQEALTSTAFYQNQTATAQARVQGEQQASANATATAQPIAAELSGLGISAGEGELAWVHPPMTLSVEGYLQYDYANNYLQEFVPADLVISSDITWNTQTGLAGCGFALRSNGDPEVLDQYMVILSRGLNGTVNFIVQSDTAISGANTRSLGTGSDPQFQLQNDMTNRLTVVARGGMFTFYTNGTEIGTIADNTYQNGYVALIALSESGTTTCNFNNTWLWLLDD
jgi:hypothetical protein